MYTKIIITGSIFLKINGIKYCVKVKCKGEYGNTSFEPLNCITLRPGGWSVTQHVFLFDPLLQCPSLL